MGEKHGRVPNLFCFRFSLLVSVCFRSGTGLAIFALQGSVNQSHFVDQVVTVEAQVRADFEESPLQGFSLECGSDQITGGLPCGVWVQKEDQDDLVAAGDRIRADLRVEENNGETIGWLLDGSLQILEVAQKLSSPVFIDPSKSLAAEWERWEGCVLHFPVLWVLDGNQEPFILYSGKNFPAAGSYSRLDQVPDTIRVRSVSQIAALSGVLPGDLLINVQGLLREDRDGYYLQLVNGEGLETIRLGDKDLFQVSSSRAQLETGSLTPDEAGTPSSPTLTPTMTETPFPVRLLISEFMADPSAREPDGEWIEIYNRDDFPVPLTDVKIGDAGTSGGKEGMLQFPPGYLIKSRDVVVVANKASVYQKEYGKLPDFELVSSLDQVPDLLPYDLWGGSKVQLSNSGDEVLLLDGWDQILDAVAYGKSDFTAAGKPIPAADEGCSLERYPPDQDRNQPGDFRERSRVSPGRLDRSPPTPRPSSTPTRTLSPTPSPSPTGTPAPPTATPPVLQLLLSEVMVNPIDAEPDGEWIEIYNPAGATMDLSWAKLGDAQFSDSREGMLTFPSGVMLESREFVLIANKAETFQDRYGFLPDFEIHPFIPEVPDLEPYPGWGGSNLQLSNQGDEILVLDGWDEILEGVAYGSSQYGGYQPPASPPDEGSSLCRDLAGPGNGSWEVCDQPSPGKKNQLPSTPSAVWTQTAAFPLTTTATASATPDPTSSSEPSRTLTPGSTAGPTDTPTPSLTGTEIATVTVLPTPVATVSLTPTLIRTAEPTLPSATIQVTETPTAVMTFSPSLTAEPTEIQTESPTASSTVSPSLSPTSDPTAVPGLILNEILADPPPEMGDANQDGVVSSSEDEFLEFVNTGTTDLDLSSWMISDQVAVRFNFPAGTILKGGCGLVVFGGGSPEGDFGGSRVLTADYLGLNNGGDQIEVRDQSGQLQLRFGYGSEGGRDQSLTRNPDLSGSFILHSDIPAANGARFSPGSRLNGSPFPDCCP